MLITTMLWGMRVIGKMRAFFLALMKKILICIDFFTLLNV